MYIKSWNSIAGGGQLFLNELPTCDPKESAIWVVSWLQSSTLPLFESLGLADQASFLESLTCAFEDNQPNHDNEPVLLRWHPMEKMHEHSVTVILQKNPGSWYLKND